MQTGKEREQTVFLADKIRGGVQATFSFLFWAIIFGVSYAQPALYYSNQNQYFLHGLARGGDGLLNEDWLANTADPTPLFSTLIAATHRFLNDIFFYFYYILIFGIYLHSLVEIFAFLCGVRASPLTRLAFLACFIALHSALLRWSSAHLLGVDYPWYFQAGIANQYLLGAGLQPSVFGVLLLLSLAAFVRDRPMLAATWAALAAVMHATYLLFAALLTISYLYLLCRDRRFRTAFVAGAWALVLVSPLLVYNVRTFAPSSAETFAESQQVLAHFRIPHHTQVERWLDGIACAQIVWILLGVFLTRGTKLFAVLTIVFISSLLLTLVQIATRNNTLALLFPWRASAILVPIATTIVLTRLLQRLAGWRPSSSLGRERIAGTAYALVLAFVAADGAAISYLHLGYRTDDRELALLEYVRAHKASGDTYLLPVEIPKSSKRGAVSLSFAPPPLRDKQKQFISIDLQRFRLFTAAPIYIDFKSIPYKDVEVLQWRQRLEWNHELYKNRDWNQEEIVRELTRRRITHVVAAVDRDVHCQALKLIYADKNYRLYRFDSPEEQ